MKKLTKEDVLDRYMVFTRCLQRKDYNELKYVELSTLREIVRSLKEDMCSVKEYCMYPLIICSCDNCKEIDKVFPPEIMEAK